MKMAWQFAVVSVLACLFSSCASQSPDEQFVHQKIPIEIQNGKVVTIEIHALSGNGENDVGIRCSPDVWNALTNGTKSITVRLKSSDKKGTQIGGVSPGSGRRWPIESFHYLFYIGGEYHAKASVEITFPNAPAEATRAEIIVDNTPADTGL